jgi:hypothetical protein
MQILIKLFFMIAILKKGPQDVPYSRFLLVSLLIIMYVSDLLQAQIPYTSSDSEVSIFRVGAFLVFASVVYYGVVYVLMRAHGFANRAIQTITALIGVELVIKLVQIPVLLLVVLAGKNSGAVLMLYMLFIMTIGWGLVANVHIFRHALSISALRASMITLALFSMVLFMNVRFDPIGGG